MTFKIASGYIININLLTLSSFDNLTNQPPTDEILLIARIAEKDESALSILYDRYAPLLCGLALKILNSVEEAEEVVLDVFSQVWKTASYYDVTRGRVDTWLFMLTRSRALDRLRKMQTLNKVKKATQEVAVFHSPDKPTEYVLIRQRRDQVLQALRQLPQEQRQVLELVYYKGLTHKEIAELTGISLGTIKTRIRLGIEKLRQSLKSWY